MTRHCLTFLALFLAPAVRAAAPPMPSDPLPNGAIARLGHARMVADPDPDRFLVSPDGRWVTCGGRWFRLADGKEMFPPVHVPDGYSFTRFLSDGAYVVSSGRTNLLFSSDSDQPRARIEYDAVAFDPRGRYCLRGDEAGEKVELMIAEFVAKWGIKKWRRIATVDDPLVRLSDDGDRIFWLHDSDSRLSVYSFPTGRTVTVPLASEERLWVRDAAISRDGKMVACRTGGDLILFDAATGEQIRNVQNCAQSGEAKVRFSPDGKEFVAPTRDGLLLVPTDPSKATVRVYVRAGTGGRRHAFFDDFRRVAVLDRAGVIRIHELRTGKQIDSHSRFPCFDGVALVGRNRAVSWSRHGAVVVWDARDGRVVSEAALPLRATETFQRMRFSDDGRHCAAWTDKGRFLLAATATGKPILTLTDTDTTSIGRAAFGPSGEEVAVQVYSESQKRTTVCYYELPSGQFLRQKPFGPGDFVFTGRGNALLRASASAVALHERDSGKARYHKDLPWTAYERADLPRLLALGQTGRRAIVVRGDDVSLFDPLTGEQVRHQVHQRDWSGPVAVSASGRWLAGVGKSNRTVFVHDLEADGPPRPVRVIHCDAGPVTGLALEGGSRLITSHGDGTCLVWDLNKPVPQASKKKAADLWEQLATTDPAAAQPAITALAKDAAATVQMLAEKLTPAVEIPPARIAGWIADLDSDNVDRRSAAERRLAAAADQTDALLRKAARKPASIEQLRRVERLLKRIDSATDPLQLRAVRAVDVLEGIGSQEAVALLEKLATGAPAARLTREAKESLVRLKRSEEP